MRKAFIETLMELAAQDHRIMLLTGDLGFTVVEDFVQKFPDRFINVGVAEQNMMGIATGLAKEGLIPFVYSIGNFAVLRPYEFIRNGLVHHHLPVRIVGIGGGFDYGPAGITHYMLEDIGVMRIHKEMPIIVPADGAQLRTALKKTWNISAPIYYRIGKSQKGEIEALQGQFDLGCCYKIKDGQDAVIVCLGSMTREALEAAQLLAEKNLHPAVVVVSSFNPSPDNQLMNFLQGASLVVTVEDHYITGGLGSYICELVAEHRLNCQVIRCGVKTPVKTSGSTAFMNEQHGLVAQKVAELIYQSLNNLEKWTDLSFL